MRQAVGFCNGSNPVNSGAKIASNRRIAEFRIPEPSDYFLTGSIKNLWTLPDDSRTVDFNLS